jgi:hypothetical protein
MDACRALAVSISKASCRIRFACWSLETLLCLHDCVDRSNCHRFVSSSYQEKQSPSVALFFVFLSCSLAQVLNASGVSLTGVVPRDGTHSH